MAKHLEVIFTPAEFAALRGRDLSGTVCVVFDVLRATSTMITALGNGADAIMPVEQISEALKMRDTDKEILLAGERDGVRIEGQMAGGLAFDFGNSPREFIVGKVKGKRIVATTTNGTRALRACAGARSVLVGSFLTLTATAAVLCERDPGALLVICSGTYEEAAYEDVLGAGALCDARWSAFQSGSPADSALLARQIWNQEKHDLLSAISKSKNGRRLLGRPELSADVAFCAQRDVFGFAAEMNRDGWVRRLNAAE